MQLRKILLPFLLVFFALIFLVRIFYLQLINHSYKNQAIENSIKKVYIYPERGYIYDRNNVLLVANKISYDVMVIPREIKNIDTLSFCKLLKIKKAKFITKLNKAKKYSKRIPSTFLKQLSKEDYAILQEKMYQFKGFYIQKRTLRNYPINSAANALGYLSETNNKIIKKDPYYKQGDLIGVRGIEKRYEKDLRGIKGVKRYNKDWLNRIKGAYKNGEQDTLAKNGRDLKLTLATKLQQYGEYLMQHKRGAIVALEPKTGEILALISAPSYNPNNLVGRKRAKYSTQYLNDKFDKPMFNRALQAQYAPGSTFKIVNALIGLQEGVITPNTSFICHHGYRYGKRAKEFMGCHCGVNGKVSFQKSIYKSCNTYYCNVYRDIIEKYDSPNKGIDTWSKYVKSFGLGNYMGVDLPEGRKGRIPNGDFYDKFYPSFRWRAVTTISNAIGQGQVETTPIQLANVTAAIANRGYYYTPHIVKNIKGKELDSTFTIPKQTNIDKKYFAPVIDGMEEVYKKGTGKYAQIKGINICGKTGTVQNYIKKDGKKIALPDHSIFIAFAPKENPKIALAVFIENGGYGSQFAAPIASLMIEKYLKNKISRPELEIKAIRSLEDIYKKQVKDTIIE